MKNRYLQFILGVIVGALIFGTTATATDYFTATVGTQQIYLAGQSIQLEAYAIHGNNFVKLRDIGEAMDFNVYWDNDSRSVQIESDKPYTGEASSTIALTEEGVQAAIRALRDIYPTGTNYGAPYRSTSNGPYGEYSSDCAGWATLCSDTAFGSLPWRCVDNPRWGDIRPGDLVRYDTASGGHVVVVLNRTAEYISVTESGTTNNTRWGGQYFKWWLEQQSGYTLYTRYPQ